MTIRFLGAARDPGKRFPGVRYNSDKVALEKGELMDARNFGALAGLSHPRPQDYINYLEGWSRQSSRIRYPQLHVALSAKGREMDKYQLCEIAHQWLSGMGYAHNPYLLIFHKDTANNHLHVVASRVGPDGKKVKDSYEREHGHRVMNELLGVVPRKDAAAAIDEALHFHIATKAQFMLLLELKGYSLKAGESDMAVYKYGKQVGTVPLTGIENRISAYQPDQPRLRQLRAIVGKYRELYNPALYAIHEPLAGGGQGKVAGYHSELSDHLHKSLGLQFVFHSKDGKQPYGFTLIDHTRKTVYKGSQLMPLAEFTLSGTETPIPSLKEAISQETSRAWEEVLADLPAADSATDLFIPTAGDLSIPPPRIDIANDIDDEQILGRNRRRKRKARTNTR